MTVPSGLLLPDTGSRAAISPTEVTHGAGGCCSVGQCSARLCIAGGCWPAQAPRPGTAGWNVILLAISACGDAPDPTMEPVCPASLLIAGQLFSTEPRGSWSWWGLGTCLARVRDLLCQSAPLHLPAPLSLLSVKSWPHLFELQSRESSRGYIRAGLGVFAGGLMPDLPKRGEWGRARVGHVGVGQVISTWRSSGAV